MTPCAQVRVSEGSGALLPPPRAVPQRWAYLAGDANRGRFTVHSTRTRRPAAHAAEAVQTMAREAEDAVVFDVQVMQLDIPISLAPRLTMVTHYTRTSYGSVY